MRIERIEINKIKVTLLTEDLEMFNLKTNKIKPNSPELHTFLCNVMKKVQSETNFNPYEGQVVVEATPCEEGLILMVSKIKKPVHKKKLTPEDVKHIKAIKKVAKKHTLVCQFDKFEYVCQVLKICGESVLDNGTLYKFDNKFYIVYKAVTPDIRLSEFAKIYVDGGVTEAFLTEHGKVLAYGQSLENISNYLKKSN